MSYDPNRHHRRSIRLKNYDYTQEGAYFVTLCTQEKICFFGTISDGRMLLSEAGSMVDQAWSGLPEHCLGIELDEFVTMPNHLHGIIVLTGRFSAVSPDSQISSPLSLGDVIRRFKTWTFTCYIEGVKRSGWQRFPGRLWQRNYHDRIIRNERELELIRHYIHYNPLGWDDDDHHPARNRRGDSSSDPLNFDAEGAWLKQPS